MSLTIIPAVSQRCAAVGVTLDVLGVGDGSTSGSREPVDDGPGDTRMVFECSGRSGAGGRFQEDSFVCEL